MSGDGHTSDLPTVFYSEEMTDAKRILINSNYILELESMFVNARYRTGSVMQE